MVSSQERFHCIYLSWRIWNCSSWSISVSNIPLFYIVFFSNNIRLNCVRRFYKRKVQFANYKRKGNANLYVTFSNHITGTLKWAKVIEGQIEDQNKVALGYFANRTKSVIQAENGMSLKRFIIRTQKSVENAIKKTNIQKKDLGDKLQEISNVNIFFQFCVVVFYKIFIQFSLSCLFKIWKILRR